MIKLHDIDVSIFERIVHAQVYFDRVVFRFHRKAERFELIGADEWLNALRELNWPGAVILAPTKSKHMNPPWSRMYLDIKQPTREALEYLRRRMVHPLCTRHVEISLDHIMATREEADLLQGIIAKTIIQKWNRERIQPFRNTLYSKRHNKREGGQVHYEFDYLERPEEGFEIDDVDALRAVQATRCIAGYSSKGARCYFVEPCAHTEFRYTNPDSVRRLGINTIDDLLNCNFQKFLKREFILIRITEEGIERMVKKIMGTSKKKKPVDYVKRTTVGSFTFEINRFKRMRSNLLRRAEIEFNGESMISAHNLKVEANDWGSEDVPKKRIFEVRMFQRIDTTPLLKCENLLACDALAEQRFDG